MLLYEQCFVGRLPRRILTFDFISLNRLIKSDLSWNLRANQLSFRRTNYFSYSLGSRTFNNTKSRLWRQGISKLDSDNSFTRLLLLWLSRSLMPKRRNQEGGIRGTCPQHLLKKRVLFYHTKCPILLDNKHVINIRTYIINWCLFEDALFVRKSGPKSSLPPWNWNLLYPLFHLRQVIGDLFKFLSCLDLFTRTLVL